MSREPIKIVADILASELGLAAGQIMLTDEDYNIPTTPGLYIALRYATNQIIGTSNYWQPTVGGLQEVQEVVMRYGIDIEIMSYDDSARQKKEMVVLALGSQQAEYQMNANCIQIARMPGVFNDVSEQEGSQMLTRYILTIGVTALTQNIKAINYYGTFQQPSVIANG